MASDGELLNSLSESYALAASRKEIIFYRDFIKKNGVSNLFNTIEEVINTEKISLLLVDISLDGIDPFSIFHLKQKYNVMVVLVALDDEYKFGWISSSLATIADLVLTSDYVSVDRYRQSGVNAHFLPLPVETPKEFSVNKKDFKHDISFVGRIAADKGYRVEFKDYLDMPEHGFNITWLGDSQGQESNYLSRSGMFEVFNKTLINLNFSDVVTYATKDDPLLNRIRCIKLRPFEIAAAAGFCLSEFSIGLEKCFKDGEEIVFFKNKEELVDKIDYYLSHPDEAKKIAKAGQKKVIKNYSSEITAKNFEQLIHESLSMVGEDLFKEKQKPQVSKLFVINFASEIAANAFNFLANFKITLFFRELTFLFRFLSRISVTLGLGTTTKLTTIIFYRVFKILVSSMINRLRT